MDLVKRYESGSDWSRKNSGNAQAQEEAKKARLDEPLDAQPPHPQGVPEDAPFRGGVTDAGPDALRG